MDSAVVRFEGDSLRLLMLDMAIDKWCEFVKFMIEQSVYKGVSKQVSSLLSTHDKRTCLQAQWHSITKHKH